MAASLKDKRTPITTPPYQVPSVDVTPDPPIFSLVTTFKQNKPALTYKFIIGRQTRQSKSKDATNNGTIVQGGFIQFRTLATAQTPAGPTLTDLIVRPSICKNGFPAF